MLSAQNPKYSFHYFTSRVSDVEQTLSMTENEAEQSGEEQEEVEEGGRRAHFGSRDEFSGVTGLPKTLRGAAEESVE